MRQNDVLYVGGGETEFADLVRGRDLWVLGGFENGEPPCSKPAPRQGNVDQTNTGIDENQAYRGFDQPTPAWHAACGPAFGEPASHGVEPRLQIPAVQCMNPKRQRGAVVARAHAVASTPYARRRSRRFAIWANLPDRADIGCAGLGFPPCPV